MTRHFSPNVQDIADSVYSGLAHRLATHQGEVFPLHVGDTWMEPPAGCRMEDLHVAEYPGMHRYASPQGMPALLDAIVERVRARTGVATERDDVLVATGATGALGAVAGAILAPGDEVLQLAPHWPLITGIVRSFGGVPVDVPFFGVADSPETAVEAVRERRTERTVALYLNTPSNPTGQIIPRPWIEALVEWARREDLWIIADEVYEDYVFAGEHTYTRPLAPERTIALYLNTPSNPAGRVIPRPWIEALVEWARREDLWIIADEVYEDYVYAGEHTYTRPLAPERTFAAHSFSKAYGMAGNRCGYVIGPAEAVAELRKIGLHSFYSTPTAAQLAALRVLGPVGDAWVA
ncbi:MAG TPA: aminotransferase class I/II-fold pyridoxal phosphate-dependent enzyme, partial [Thermoanaerobaculia bacterium]